MNQDTEKLGADSPLAELINWDAIGDEAPEVEEKPEDSSLKDGKKETTQEKPDAGDDTKEAAKEEVGEQKTETKEAEKGESNVEQKQEQTPAPTVNEDELRSKLEKELREQITSEYEAKAPKFANESIAKLNELAEAGVDINSGDFWAWQSRDLDKYDTANKAQALEVARLELEIDNPDIPTTKIDRLLKRKYPALFDESLDSDDKEYQEAVEDLEIDAIRGLRKLKEHKGKITLPTVDLKSQEQAKEAARKAQETFVMDTKKTVNNYKEEPYKLSDDLEIKFQISDDARKFAEGAIVNNQTFFLDNYTEKNEKGEATSVDYSRLARDMTRLVQFDDFVKVAFEQGVSVGKDSLVEELENSDNSVSKTKQDGEKSIEDQVAEQLQAKFHRQR